MVLILLGPPGVGKGTQGALLTADFGWLRIATGDLLREARRNGTPLGVEAQRFMDAGELVPDTLILNLVREVMAGLPEGAGVLFDGFPRTVPQAEGLDELLRELGHQVDAVILLEASDDIVVKRISGRRSTPDGARIYNVYFNPPKVEGFCDQTGEALVHREDDQPATVVRRLEVYQSQTSPLVAYYDSSPSVVLRVDGASPLEQVRSDIRVALSEALGVGIPGA
jgi:adenylate kinase